MKSYFVKKVIIVQKLASCITQYAKEGRNGMRGS
jgi:hypothetical protein